MLLQSACKTIVAVAALLSIGTTSAENEIAHYGKVRSWTVGYNTSGTVLYGTGARDCFGVLTFTQPHGPVQRRVLLDTIMAARAEDSGMTVFYSVVDHQCRISGFILGQHPGNIQGGSAES